MPFITFVFTYSLFYKSITTKSTMYGIGSFNVRGLQSNIKEQSLARDMKTYSMDFTGLQETKITTSPINTEATRKVSFKMFLVVYSPSWNWIHRIT
jgi:exonuclease III